MNVSSRSPTSIMNELPASGSEVRLLGRWLLVARIACLSVSLLAVVIWVWGIPLRYAQLGTVCAAQPCGDQQPTPTSMAQFQAAGVTLGFYAAYIGTLEVLFMLVYLVLAALLFWRKSDTRIGLLTGLFLVTQGATQTSATALAAAVPAWAFPVTILQPLSSVCLILFLYLFPDGRFVPRWTGFVVLVWTPLFLMSTAVLPDGRLVALLFGFIVLSLFAQIYRYRRVSSAAQRRQTKWVVFGTLTGSLGSIGIISAANLLPKAQSPGGLGFLAGDTLVYVFGMFLPLSLGIAILRSRLWDIDLLINRTLVYGSLSAILAAIYFADVVGVQALLTRLTQASPVQASPVLVVVTTLLIAALFQPLRRRIQATIDRRFYRRKYDARRTLATFSATLRQEVDLPTLTASLMQVVEKTMQPAHVTLWLRTPTSEVH